jgi:PIN domain nuclease of toxin-antitoxin system
MNIDTESEGGSWRREMLARPLSTSELRNIISELEHCLTVERARTRDMVTRLTDAVEMEMKLRAEIARLKTKTETHQPVDQG